MQWHVALASVDSRVIAIGSCATGPVTAVLFFTEPNANGTRFLRLDPAQVRPLYLDRVADIAHAGFNPCRITARPVFRIRDRPSNKLPKSGRV
jgi:hypothetical protein